MPSQQRLSVQMLFMLWQQFLPLLSEHTRVQDGFKTGHNMQKVPSSVLLAVLCPILNPFCGSLLLLNTLLKSLGKIFWNICSQHRLCSEVSPWNYSACKSLSPQLPMRFGLVVLRERCNCRKSTGEVLTVRVLVRHLLRSFTTYQGSSYSS